MNIKTIDHKDAFFEEVVNLGKSNARTLGLFPRDAFIEHARKRHIIIATKDGQLLGYILFRITQKTRILNIAHLCIHPSCRKGGVATKLLEVLKEKYNKQLKGIALSCREDYEEATALWKRNGFISKDRVRSRSKDEKYLIKWWFDFVNEDLFSTSDTTSTKIRVALDSSVIIKLSDNVENDSEVNSLLADWLVDDVKYYYAAETNNEILRDKNISRASDTLKYLNNFESIRCTEQNKKETLGLIDQILTGKNENDISDRKQLAECMAYGIEYFITLDDRLLNNADTFYEKFGLRIFRPTEFILYVDQLKNKSNYHAYRLNSVQYEYKKADYSELKGIIDFFINDALQERKHHLENAITSVAPDVKNAVFKIVKNKDGKNLGFYIAIKDSEKLVVKVIRTRGKTSEILFQQFLNDIIMLSIKETLPVIEVHDKYVLADNVSIMETFGFEKKGEIWYKIALKLIVQSKNVLENVWIRKYWDTEAISKKIAINSNTQELYKLQIERRLWPLKIADIDIPTYIIPIKPYWAGQLFDANLSNQSLFGSRPELMWSKENVYYRSVKPVSEVYPARILWYASSDKQGGMLGREKGIIACSYLDEVEIGSAKSLYQKFKNLGIYEWTDIYNRTNLDAYAEIKILKFSDTEVFEKIVSLASINKILNRNGKPSNTFASPLVVTKDIFVDIYTLATNNNE